MDLPGNKALTREIGRLREKWQCHSTSCGQYYCYVHPDEKTHFSLSHTHFNVWASAIVSVNYNCVFFYWQRQIKGPEGAKAKPSTLLQRRAATQVQASSSTSLIINFNIPKEVLTFFGKVPAPATPATASLAPAASIVAEPNTPLFSPTLKPAMPYLLMEFCATYQLSQNILACFEDQGFTALNQLCYISLSDLKGMLFKPGEIASIQDAIAIWTSSLWFC